MGDGPWRASPTPEEEEENEEEERQTTLYGSAAGGIPRENGGNQDRFLAWPDAGIIIAKETTTGR